MAAAGKQPADLESRFLIEAATGFSSLALVTEPERPLGEGAAILAAFAQRRLAHEPVSRILGRSGFYGLDLRVAPNVLDPRADTEILVDAALGALRASGVVNPLILDLGTGSGAILCALLQERPDAFGLGVDFSPAACALASENLARCGFSARSGVIRGDWFAAIGRPVDLVVSNPPYITQDELLALDPEVAAFDPVLALDGGVDGLAPYRLIAPSLANLLRPKGAACFEIGWRQAPDVVRILSHPGFAAPEVRQDSAGHDRVVSVHRF